MTAPTTARREIAGHELVREAAIRLKRERREPGEDWQLDYDGDSEGYWRCSGRCPKCGSTEIENVTQPMCLPRFRCVECGHESRARA